MTFIVKALTTLDGVARDLDPQYSLIVAAKPFVTSLATTQVQGSLGELARQTSGYLTQRLTQPSRTEILLQCLEARLEQQDEQLRSQAADHDRMFKTLQLTVKTLLYASLTGGATLTGSVLVGAYPMWAIGAFSCAGCSGLFLLKSLIKLTLREQFDRLAGR